MFGLMTVSAHERAMLDMECELQHARKGLEYARRREKARIECMEALEGELEKAKEETALACSKLNDVLDAYEKIQDELSRAKAALSTAKTRCAYIAADAERARSKIRELQLMKDSLESLWNARSDPELDKKDPPEELPA
jgi:predicted  nucleic acid-binding Zn-ribbon protein